MKNSKNTTVYNRLNRFENHQVNNIKNSELVVAAVRKLAITQILLVDSRVRL